MRVRLRFNTIIGMYSFDIAQNQYHKMSKYTDKSDYINDHYDRSMRANIDTL